MQNATFKSDILAQPPIAGDDARIGEVEHVASGILAIVQFVRGIHAPDKHGA